MTKNLQDKVNQQLDTVIHPAIDLSLPKLGIIKETRFIDDTKVLVVFAFPFAEIPIADQLFYLVHSALQQIGLEMRYQVVVMNEAEKARFMELEASAWRGL